MNGLSRGRKARSMKMGDIDKRMKYLYSFLWILRKRYKQQEVPLKKGCFSA